MLKMLCSRELLVIIYMMPFIVAGILCIYVLSLEECHCPDSPLVKDIQQVAQQVSKKLIPAHKLAILVPFRERFNELLTFVPHMTAFLKLQSIQHHIFVLNQVDNLRFNRASLINVGFMLAKVEHDYIAMHDVDLLPLNKQLKYLYPNEGVLHISSPDLHPRYNYPTFVGGILLIKREDFEKVNGMSNRYWGWGLEDDEFYVRLKDAKINVLRPQNIGTNKNNTFRHTHDRNIRKRDMQKCFNQREVTRKRDHVTGLRDVRYKIQSIQQLVIDKADVTVVNIELQCNRELTPWCNCDAPLVASSTTSKANMSKNA